MVDKQLDALLLIRGRVEIEIERFGGEEGRGGGNGLWNGGD